MLLVPMRSPHLPLIQITAEENVSINQNIAPYANHIMKLEYRIMLQWNQPNIDTLQE